METKKKITLMLILIILLQGILPMLSIVFENCFTIISKATTEWDISKNGDGTVKAILDEETGTLTIEGTGAMKNWSFSSSAPWYSYSMRNTIQKVIIKEGVTSIGSSAFAYCSNLTSIEIPISVTSIGIWTFDYCSSLTSIEIPSSVTSIGDGAFTYCSSLTSINIPEGVTSIGSSAFEYCSSLTSINVDINNKKYSSENGVLFNKDKTELLKYPAGKKETRYTIPEGVTSIGNQAFYSCSSLTSIELPEGVTSIGNQAFYSCSSLTSIEIPSSVTSIGGGAFTYCSSLTRINVDINNKKYSSENGVLLNKYKTEIRKYPEGKKETRYTIPSSVTSIGGGAFTYCSSLTSINIPEGVTSIGNHAFNYCSSLTSIELPSSVTSIESFAFSGCRSLKSINIPEGVTSIGSNVFYDCRSLTSIELPSSVTSIESFAFHGCSSLTSIEIPSSVTSIGSNAFYSSKLTITVANGGSTAQEVELPEIIKRAKKEGDILYTEKDFTLTNCSLSEDKTKLIVDTKIANTKTVGLEVNGGALNDLTVVVVVVPSGTITYSTKSLTNNPVIATLHIAKGETITNNNGENTYTFTKNGEFTFQYTDLEGNPKTATAKVTNIKQLKVTSEKYSISSNKIARSKTKNNNKRF